MMRRFLFAAGIFVAVQAVAYVLVFIGQLDAIDLSMQEEWRLKKAYVVKMNQAVNLNLYRAQLVEIDKMVSELSKQLPNRWNDPEFRLVRRLANAQGLRIDMLRPAPKETSRGFYAQLPARLELTGPFHKVAAFAVDLTQLPGITVMGPFSIERSPAAGMVTLKSVIWTFRYIDKAELIAKQTATVRQKIQ